MEYWVSALVQGPNEPRAWLLSSTTSETTLKAAKDKILYMRSSYTVLSAWIDTFDSNNKKKTVYHECNVDTFGNVRY